MLEHDAIVVSIGLESGYVTGTVHLAELAVGIPYRYTKLLKWRTIVNGHPIETPFFSYARYLHVEMEGGYELSSIVQGLDSEGTLKKAKLGNSFVFSAPFKRSFALMIELLMEDPYSLLSNSPKFEYGVLPFDGPTQGVDGIGENADSGKMVQMNWSGYYLAGRDLISDDSGIVP